jgi:hypothetical protein
MRRKIAFVAGAIIAAMLGTMALAEQNNKAPAVRQQAEERKLPVGQAATSSRPNPGKAGLSKRNKAMINQTEQRKLRQIEINKEQAADPQLK